MIWSSEEYAELGAWSHPFRISIPPEAAKQAPSSTCFKEWKTVWKFDTSIEHEPIPYVGHRITKSYLLDIVNHRIAKSILPSPPPDPRITITRPEGAFGPGDRVEIALQAKSEEQIKRATMVLERVVEHTGGKTDITPIVSASHDLAAERCCMTLHIPKRSHRWDTGETTNTKLAQIRFQLHIKLKPAKLRSRDIQCDPIPINVCATTLAQRAEAAAASKGPRKHRSARRGLYIHQGTVDISSDVVIPRSPTSRSVSPYSPLNLKPILLHPDHQPLPSQNISFIFPSPPPHSAALQPGTLPPLSLPLRSSDFESWSMIKQFQQSGRRISTTASEEEAMQPSRSRQRLVEDDTRPSLPSLDTLGLGLPHVTRRPVTAPAFMPFTSTPFRIPELVKSGECARPKTSAGLAQDNESESSNMLSPHTFAFNVKEE